jgi:hypothetical protein
LTSYYLGAAKFLQGKPSRTKQDQTKPRKPKEKMLGFAWILSSGSGLFKGLRRFRVTGANSRARNCTRQNTASAKASHIKHLRERRLSKDAASALLAREFAPLTIPEKKGNSQAGFAAPLGGPAQTQLTSS